MIGKLMVYVQKILSVILNSMVAFVSLEWFLINIVHIDRPSSSLVVSLDGNLPALKTIVFLTMIMRFSIWGIGVCFEERFDKSRLAIFVSPFHLFLLRRYIMKWRKLLIFIFTISNGQQKIELNINSEWASKSKCMSQCLGKRVPSSFFGFLL